MKSSIYRLRHTITGEMLECKYIGRLAFDEATNFQHLFIYFYIPYNILLILRLKLIKDKELI